MEIELKRVRYFMWPSDPLTRIETWTLIVSESEKALDGRRPGQTRRSQTRQPGRHGAAVASRVCSLTLSSCVSPLTRNIGLGTIKAYLDMIAPPLLAPAGGELGTSRARNTTADPLATRRR